eukprot:scaffold4049_cov63-Cyclotella_meneghiniana.AAC.2
MLRTIPSKTKGHTQAILDCRREPSGTTIQSASRNSLQAQLRPRIVSRSIRGHMSRIGRYGSTQLDYGCDHATINGAAALINGSRCTKCVCAGGTAISGWLLCESRRFFRYGRCVVAVVGRRLVFFFDRRRLAGVRRLRVVR